MNEQEPRRLAVSDILERGARLVFGNLPVFLRATALLIVPAYAILIALLLVIGVHSVSKTVGYSIAAVMLAGILLTLVLAGGVCLKLASDLERGEKPGARTSLCFLRAKLGPFLLLAALILVAVVPGVVLLFILIHSLGRLGLLALLAFALSLWLAGIWSVALPVLLIEDKSLKQALARSRELVRGYFGHALGTVILGSIVALFIGVLAEILSSVLMTGSDKERFIVYVFGLMVGEFLAIPLLAAYAIVLYYDLRLREEDYGFGRPG
ncbi:MAG: hypothetical protein ABSC51_10345 [Gaiellaceae bacterium]|jgi:hypothetical protein